MAKQHEMPRTQTVEDVAEEHDVTTETVRRWVRDGCPADRPGRGKPTKLNAAEVEAWKRENGVTGKQGRPTQGDSADLEKARLRKENALAAKHELWVEREKGLLVPAQEVKQRIGELVTTARNKLLGMGAQLAPLLEGRDAAERQTIIEDRVTEILNELAA